MIRSSYMAILVYNLSTKILANLKRIEDLRANILLHPLSLKDEQRLKWDANLSRIYWSLTFKEKVPSKKLITKVLTSPTPKKTDAITKDIIALNNTFSFIKQNWMVSTAKVKIKDIKKLYDISCKPVMGSAKGFTSLSEKNINHTLDYIQSGKENPIIQAGIAQAELLNTIPFEQGSARISRLINYLFLYKAGYDMRGLLVIDEFLRRDLVIYKQASESVHRNKNLTFWLEYFTHILVLSLSKSLENVKNLHFYLNTPPSFWKLNERQKNILQYLEAPDTRITNKQVQKMFTISQITASRDLSRLASLGLLFSRGKGRSVYYISV